jgi:nucleoside-diphosphate-sugar epimerase
MSVLCPHCRTMNTSSPPNTVLINGAAGRFGRVAVAAFAQAGWRVIAQVRRPGLVAWPVGVREVVAGAAVPEPLHVLVHAANPPYTQWATQALPLAQDAMALAQQHDALFMLPGNVYNVGSPMPALISANTPMQPTTRKGRVREAIEAALRNQAGLRSATIRAGDFFGGAGTGSWFDVAVVKSLRAGKLVYPGPLHLPHAWAYLPDLAQAFVAVAALHRSLRGHHHVPFAGHNLSGGELLAGIEQAAQTLGLQPSRPWRRGSMPWGLIRTLSPLVPMWREISEIAYLWHEPHALDGAALHALVGELPHTPAPTALRQALSDLFIKPITSIAQKAHA